VFVVYLEPRKGAAPTGLPHKAFAEREAADAYAAEQLEKGAGATEVWTVPADDPAEAIAAVEKFKAIKAAAEAPAPPRWTPAAAPPAPPRPRKSFFRRASPVLATLLVGAIGVGAAIHLRAQKEAEPAATDKAIEAQKPAEAAKPAEAIKPVELRTSGEPEKTPEPLPPPGARDASSGQESRATPDQPPPAPPPKPADAAARPGAGDAKPARETKETTDAPAASSAPDPLPTQSIPDRAKSPAKPRAQSEVERPAPKPEKAKPSRAKNAAALYCESRGGRSETYQGLHGQYGVCRLPNGRSVEEWQFYRRGGGGR
jgi:putative hemolysin